MSIVDNCRRKQPAKRYIGRRVYGSGPGKPGCYLVGAAEQGYLDIDLVAPGSGDRTQTLQAAASRGGVLCRTLNTCTH
jgi:hypothetical protein